ncbi:sulfotransferase [uncultured Desulfuromonas sp.]|nr:sulfotransferase [uncultured Desulfuromonas sp.]
MGEFNGPIFIVGMPRSGTKLLRGILNNHPDVAFSSSETEILPFWAKHWPEYGDLRDFENFQIFYNSAIKSSYFHYIEKSHGKIISAKKWHEACGDWTVAGVFESLVRLDTGCTTQMIWGDKSPSYIRHIPLLMELFPGGKFIYIVRDVRDYCLSINKAWGKNMIRAAQRWADDVGNAKASLACCPNRAIEVRFEDLLDNPKKELQAVCDFIGISFGEDMLFFENTTEKIGGAQGATEVVEGNKGKWQAELSAAKVRKIEKVCMETLHAYKYSTTYEGPVDRIHPLMMEALKVLDGVNLLFHDNEKRGLFKNILFYLRYSKHSGSSC